MNGAPLIATVISRLRRQTKAQILINAPNDSPYGNFSLEMLPDVFGKELGPLSGIHAALSWAWTNGHAHIATVPVDTPFLPDDMIARLTLSGAPAICASRGRNHFVCGLWKSALAGRLETLLETGARAAGAWAVDCKASIVPFDDDENGRDPFFNVNTRDELVKAQWQPPLKPR